MICHHMSCSIIIQKRAMHTPPHIQFRQTYAFIPTHMSSYTFVIHCHMCTKIHIPWRRCRCSHFEEAFVHVQGKSVQGSGMRRGDIRCGFKCRLRILMKNALSFSLNKRTKTHTNTQSTRQRTRTRTRTRTATLANTHTYTHTVCYLYKSS